MRRWRSALLLAFIAPGFLTHLSADEPKPDPAQHSVFVPYDEKQPPDLEQAQRFYLDYQEFQRLWDLAKKTRQPLRVHEDTTKGQPDVSLNAAQYRMTVFDDHLEVEAQLEVVSHGGAWAKWRLPFSKGDIAVNAAEVDGKAASFENAELLFEAPGAHRVVLNFQIKQSKNWREAQVSIPPSPAALLTIAVPSTDGPPKIGAVDPSWILEANASGPGANGHDREYTLPVSDLATLTLSRTVARPREETAPPATLTTNVTLIVGPQLERVQAQFQFGFTGVERDRFTLELEDQARILSWNIPDLKSISMREAEGRLFLDVFLERPHVDQYTMSLQAERLWNGPAPRRPMPLLTGAARSRSTIWTIHSASDLDVRVGSAPGLDRVAPQFTAASPSISVGAWRMANSATPPTYTVAPAGNRSSAKIQTVYQLTRQKAEIIATLDLEAGHGSIEEVRVGIPSGYDVETVAGPAVRGWNRETDQLMVHLTNGENPTAKLAIHLAHTAPQPTEQWTLSPLRLPAFEKVQSQVLVAVHVADEVKLTYEAQDRQIHEVDPASLTTSLSVTPPFSFKRALTVQKQDWTAQVTLRRSPARFAADAVLLAQATDSGLKISQLLSILVEQGGLDRIKVRMPKDLPEARVQGPLVRDAQSSIVGPVREYDISFQTEVLQDTSISMELELPLDGQKTLPIVQVPAADRLRTFIVTDNVSELEMRTEIASVDPAIASGLPYLPENIQRPVFYQARPESQVKISLNQLQTTAANAAIVTLADITTDLRTDGERWNTVVYSLANRSLQFLPVRLPREAELVEVKVGNQNVRADLGKSTAPQSTLYLIPLIQMRAGELSQEVRLVYRLPASSNQKFALDQPELEGFTVERTLWHVHTPQGMRLKHWDGNMEEVPETVVTDEKNLQKLSDAGRLNRLLTSGKISEQDAAEARYNAGKAIDEVQKSQSQSQPARGHISRNSSDKAAQADLSKEEKSNDELKRQIQQQQTIYQANAKSPQRQKALPEEGITITKTGVGSWKFQQSGQLQLSGSNTYTGGSVINQGALSTTAVNDNVVVGSDWFGKPQGAVANGNNSFTNNARAAYANSGAPPPINQTEVANGSSDVWTPPAQASQNSFTAQAAHAVQQGDIYANERRWSAAQQSYQFAFHSAMPNGPVASEIRAAAQEHFNHLTTKIAREKANTGHYDEAMAMVNQALSQSPQNKEALALQKQLTDPNRFSPSLNAEHLAKAGTGTLTLNGGALTYGGSYTNGVPNLAPQFDSSSNISSSTKVIGSISNGSNERISGSQPAAGATLDINGAIAPLQIGQAVSGTNIDTNVSTYYGTVSGSGGITVGGSGTTTTISGSTFTGTSGTTTGTFGAGTSGASFANGSIVMQEENTNPSVQLGTTAGALNLGGAVSTLTPPTANGTVQGGETTMNGFISLSPSNYDISTNNGIVGGAVAPPSAPGLGGGVGFATYANKLPAPPNLTIISGAAGKAAPAQPQFQKDVIETEPFNPSLTPEHVKNVADVKRHLELGRANHELGLLDESVAEYESVLRIDPYNKSARQEIEKLEQEKSRDYDVARNHTRAKILGKIDADWKDSVSGGNRGFGVVSSQLKPAGRISLTVDVPQEGGEVYHFRKLKDHAELDLTLEQPWSYQQWRNLQIFGWGLLLIVVLEAARRLWARRSRATRSVA